MRARRRTSVEREGRRCLAVAGDVGDPSFCETAVKQVADRFGKLDILVNNAAEQHPKPDIGEITPEQLDSTFRTNIFGYFFMTQAALPHLGAGAAIVNTSFGDGLSGQPRAARLCLDQGRDRRLHALARADAGREGHPRQRRRAGSDLDAADPVDLRSTEKVKSFGADTPMKRPGQPNEVAPAFLFLACEDSSYITGSFLHPNGGEPTES